MKRLLSDMNEAAVALQRCCDYDGKYKNAYAAMASWARDIAREEANNEANALTREEECVKIEE